MKKQKGLPQKINWLLKEKYKGGPNTNFKKDVERLKEGEPLDYVIGFTEFLGCKIDLSKKPLIPRPETEYWTEKAIEQVCSKINDHENRRITVLDLFSGSGCIGIAMLKNVKNAEVTFAEKNKKCIEQIKINLDINKKLLSYSLELEKRWKVIKSDVFSNVKGKYDYIFANPPYIAKNRINKIQKSVLRYESKTALFGGQDGFFYIRKFLAKAKNFLNKKGKIYMEFDSIQKNQIEKLLNKYHYDNWKFFKDQYGKWRYLTTNQ